MTEHNKRVTKASKICDHNGIRYQYEVRKIEYMVNNHTATAGVVKPANRNTGPVYECDVSIFYPSGIGGRSIIDTKELEKLLNGGLKLTANPAKNGFIEGFIEGHIDCIMQKHEDGEDQTMSENFKPRTNATPDQIKEMGAEVERLIASFTPRGVAKLGGIMDGKSLTAETVRSWSYRGRIPATWANQLCKNEVVAGAGFTRETLRPDVPYWHVD